MAERLELAPALKRFSMPIENDLSIEAVSDVVVLRPTETPSVTVTSLAIPE